MGKINIKEQNRNKFTAYAREHGMTVSKMANTILRNREKYSPAMIKRAAYALKASKWSDGGMFMPEYKSGGIHINPANKGKFNATKKSTGKSTEELTHSDNPVTRKRAIFAQNAKKWKHADGGIIGDSNKPYNLDEKGAWSPTVWNGDMYTSMVRNGVINSDTLSQKQFSKYSLDQVTNLVNANPDFLRVQKGTSSTNNWGKTFLAKDGYTRPSKLVPTPLNSGNALQRYETDWMPGQQGSGNINKVGDKIYFPPKYDEGGVTPNVTSAVGTGFMSALSTAAPIVGAASSLFSMGKGIYDSIQAKKVAEEQRVQGAISSANTAQAGILNNYPATFRTGGQFKGKKFGGTPNAVVGGGEIVMTPDGIMTNMKGPSDMNGGKGMDVAMPDGTMIINKKNSKDLLSLSSKINKNKEVLEGEGTKLAKESSKKNLNKYYSRVLDVYNKQEAKKGKSGDMMNQFAGGGEYVAPDDLMNIQPQLGSLNDWQNNNVKFSNPLDDPNSPLFNPAQSKIDTFKGSSFDKWGDVGNIATAAGEMAPMLYNIGQGLFGKREYQNANDYKNPYEGSINSLMSNRRYNIDAPLAANEAAFRTTSANMRNLGGSRGQVMSNLTGAQNTKQFADMALYGQQSNVNNQYRGEQANMQYGLGRDVSMTKMSVDEGNLMTRATGRNFTGAAMTGLQQYLLTRRQMKGQASRDKMLANAIKGYSPYSSKWIPGLGN